MMDCLNSMSWSKVGNGHSVRIFRHIFHCMSHPKAHKYLDSMETFTGSQEMDLRLHAHL